MTLTDFAVAVLQALRLTADCFLRTHLGDEPMPSKPPARPGPRDRWGLMTASLRRPPPRFAAARPAPTTTPRRTGRGRSR